MPTDIRFRRSRQAAFRAVHILACFVTFTLLIGRAACGAPPHGAEVFETKIRPILVEHCQKCHGHEKQWSGLRLDSREAALTGGDSGPAIVAGKPDESELIRRITDADDDVRMPPVKDGKRLNAAQVTAIRQWIEAGATWPDSPPSGAPDMEQLRRDHWAFQPIRVVEPPRVAEQSRVENAIDAFVIAGLEAAGLRFAPEADRRTLIRRATFDLTGLPPTPTEVNDFVNDTRADAYERLVERLLASPRYGEQWGRYWLDIARYADAKGYVYEREHRFFVHSGLYRDWVIDAFNDDLPYDRFIMLQLAADQFAPEDREALAAMGFLTLGRRMLGVTPDVIDDRIDLVSRGLLGLTVGCARCHDHKYDPIPTTDYYSLYGVFQNCIDVQLPLPTRGPESEADKKSLAELEALQKKLAETIALRRNEAATRVRSQIREHLLAQRKLDDYPDLGVIPTINKGELLPAFVRRWEAYLKEAVHRQDPVCSAWAAYADLPAEEFSTRAPEINERLLAAGGRINPRIAAAFATPPVSPDDVAERYANVFSEIDAAWIAACADAKAAGAADPESLPDPNDEALRQVLYGDDSPCYVPDEPIVNTEYFWDLKDIDEIWKCQKDVDEWLRKHPTVARYVVVPTDRAKIVEPVVFRRGNPMNRGEKVPRQFLGVISAPERAPFQQGSGRLDLARAITDPNNPLTSRVWANRVWLQHFGAGLVTTPSDFGARSNPPSHPELLDWLAGQFVANGWSTKWLHRTIMLSATYRQASMPPADEATFKTARERDPENRLLWRMNPHRLTFEQFRDMLLAASGELDLTAGGNGSELMGLRRTVYVTVDRQYLPNVFHVFDFANPDLHVSQRSETTNPQQALYALNNPFLADRARSTASAIKLEANTPEAKVRRAYQLVLQRDPSLAEIDAAERFLVASDAETNHDQLALSAKAWSYGYGEIEPKSGLVKSFHPLPHFTGAAWQGGATWPDEELGWVQLTAKGGHTGNDHEHAVIRRWTASASGVIVIKSEISHQEAAGDGVRSWVVSSRDGVLAAAPVYNNRKQLDVDSIKVDPGDTIDFVVDVGKSLNSDQFVWNATINYARAPLAGGTSSGTSTGTWNAAQDFPRIELQPLEQFVQLLFICNESMFVD